MPGNNKFSIYPSQSAKIQLHIFYWIVFYFFILFVSRLSFNLSLFDLINVLFSCGELLIIILIHYFLSYFTFPYVRKKKWHIVLINLLLVYLISIMGATVIFKALKELYPKSEIMSIDYKRYGVNHFSKLFSFNAALWVLINIIWYTIPGMFIKIIKDTYENLQEKLAIIKEKNAIELNFLRAQIQPHFLFNSLNNIYGLVIDNEPASQAVLQLSNLLRFSIHDGKKGNITLKEEIVFLTNYILLEKIRHKENRVQINYDFEKIENVEHPIKPLILVNFIENAFKHGINASIKKMWVNIAVTEEGGFLTFRIANNKPKITSSNPIISNKSSGIGLSNVRRRLELEYYECYSLDVKETDDLFEVVLVIKLHQ
jgi:sensor histidine kinase YesM